MKWIEFIGPSGVGKSFLYNELLKTRNSNDWITPDEGLEIVYNSLTESKKVSYKKRVISSVKNFYFRKKSTPFKRISSSYKKKAVDKYGSRFNFFSEVMLREFASGSRLEPKKKIQMISWYYENRLLPFIVLYAGELNHTIVFEDGIFHNIRMVNLEKHLDNIDSEGQVIYPDATIYLKAEPEIICERIKRRNSITGGTFIQRDYTDKQIKKSVKSTLNYHRTVVSHLKENDRMVLELDATKNVQKNCKIICQFIRDLNRTK